MDSGQGAGKGEIVRATPEHYQTPAGDLIDAWRGRYSPEVFQTLCWTQIERYFSRYRKKDGMRDLRKGLDYVRLLVESHADETGEKRPETALGRFYGARGADTFAELDVALYGDLIRLTGCAGIDLTPQEAVRFCRALVNAIKRCSPDMDEWDFEKLGHA